jgi:hypothetical protein
VGDGGCLHGDRGRKRPDMAFSGPTGGFSTIIKLASAGRNRTPFLSVRSCLELTTRVGTA